ncbi:hypothetical protein BC332_05168 [Capsicum chinense]|nr:hypothetical protein BC332_05168 [Capsicum chinense]
MIPSTFSADPPYMASNSTFSPPPSVAGNDDFNYDVAWYGNIQYLLNISAVEALTCLFIFIFGKLRSDHRRMSGTTVIASKLLVADMSLVLKLLDTAALMLRNTQPS